MLDPIVVVTTLDDSADIGPSVDHPRRRPDRDMVRPEPLADPEDDAVPFFRVFCADEPAFLELFE